MYWDPMASSAPSKEAPSVLPPYTMGMMPSSTASAEQTAEAPTTTRASLPGPTPMMMQLLMSTSGTQSFETNTRLLTPPQQRLFAQGSDGVGTATGSMPSMMEPSQMYIMSLPGAQMPLNYVTQTLSTETGAPMMMPSGVTLAYPASGTSMGSSAYSMPPSGGGFFNVSPTSVAVYPARSVSSASSSPSLATMSEHTPCSLPFYSSASQVASQCFPGAGSSFGPTGPFTPAGAIFVQGSTSGPSASFVPPPQYSSVVNSSAGGEAKPLLDSHPTPVVRKGDAGKGYEAGMYYEGRVKRFNPIRGYGFVSAMYKLMPLLKYRQMKESKAPGPVSTPDNKDRTSDRKPLDDTGSGTEKEGKTSEDAPLHSERDVGGEEELNSEINGDDLVYIKGVPHVRQPVTMGDVFVHYNCLQRSPDGVNMEGNGGFANLPAGSRVQFKVEVFVPAELMEKASDDKEAAAMLNSLGVPVEENENLLSGAIATKKGWGYQAIDVVVLPPKSTLQAHVAPRNCATATEGVASGDVSNVSLSSFVSGKHRTSQSRCVTDERKSSSSNSDQSHKAPGSLSIMPPLSQALRIHIPVENLNVPPPPSFEAATAGMQYMTLPFLGATGMPNYTLGHYM
ncbi:hypothetical protein, unknown function [Leishmania tarentolae]|uniref:CSD domain-containing protein n=1 Tax=Leishmania tarentolae TaxID=5689 RepID=A0A640KNF7_LEITA|nr:hypothetical protein, unknown function [Leishmania tarentolae]